MALPTISGTAKILADPELRFGQSGIAVLKVRMAFNSRKKDPNTGAWSDDRSFYVTGVLFNQAAENGAEALVRLTEVVVTGRLCTEEWEDKNGGGKRSAPSLLIDSIGPAVNQFQTASVRKLERSGGGNAPRGGGEQDPWASAAPASGGRSNFSDEPPF
jgi:single-strand DNA-binding protein